MNDLTQPEFLTQGDKIAFLAPAGRINKSLVSLAKEQFENWGFEVMLGKQVFNTYNTFAGTHEERASDFQSMLDNPKIKAIFCIRGGYGTIRILHKLDFTAFKRKPKWIIGFSDITVLHAYINHHLKIQTIHGPMAYIFKNNASNKESIENLKKVLFGERLHYSIQPSEVTRPGNIEGILTGGNISVMYSLNNTPYDFKTDHTLLFIEDIGEYYYHLDRMMMNFKLQGKLQHLAGLIVGQMTGFKEGNRSFGKSAYEIVKEHVAEYHYPVIYGFPAGHECPNLPMIFGKKWRITIDPSGMECYPLDSPAMAKN